jgi:hypothetical protein
MVFVSDPFVEHVYPDTPWKLTTYDFTKGTFQQISNNDSGIVWAPKWSPMGDWIAYLDDSKAYKNSVDVVALIRPDGSDQYYLDGAGQSPNFSASGLSWDPEGKRLIAEGTPYYGARLIIFDDLFNGSPKVLPTRLPTQEQIGKLYDREDELFRQGYSREIVQKYSYDSGGVACSPDGQLYKYDLATKKFEQVILPIGGIEKVSLYG